MLGEANPFRGSGMAAYILSSDMCLLICIFQDEVVQRYQMLTEVSRYMHFISSTHPLNPFVWTSPGGSVHVSSQGGSHAQT